MRLIWNYQMMPAWHRRDMYLCLDMSKNPKQQTKCIVMTSMFQVRPIVIYLDYHHNCYLKIPQWIIPRYLSSFRFRRMLPALEADTVNVSQTMQIGKIYEMVDLLTLQKQTRAVIVMIKGYITYYYSLFWNSSLSHGRGIWQYQYFPNEIFTPLEVLACVAWLHAYSYFQLQLKEIWIFLTTIY